MKLLVIGVGNCGSRIAGAFSDLNRKAKTERRVQIVTTAYAVNNNREELASLSRAKDIQAIFVNKSLIKNRFAGCACGGSRTSCA